MGCIESHVEMDVENRDISSSLNENNFRMLLNTDSGKANKKWKKTLSI